MIVFVKCVHVVKGACVMIITFKTNVPLGETMLFEEEYFENLQMDLQEKSEILKSSIVVWLLVNNQLVGEAYGVSLDFDEEIEGTQAFKGRSDVIYCYSNTIIKGFQRSGLGSILKAYWLGMVKQAGFSVVIGHARPNGSQELNKKFGAKMGDVFYDWYGTKENYIMYQLDLA
jgi:hypothetical protein